MADKKEDNKLDKRFGEALRSYSETPPAGMFSRIENTLARMEDTTPARTVRRRRLRPLYRYASIAAALLLAVAAALYFGNRRGAEISGPYGGDSIATLASEPPIQHTAEERLPQHIGLTGTNTADTNTVPHSQGAQATASGEGKNIGEGVAENHPAGNLPTETNYGGKTPDYAATIPAEQPRPAEIPSERDRKEESVGKKTQQYWDRLIAQDAAVRKRPRGGKISGSMYAGNFGTLTGDLRSNDPARAAHAGMLIKQASDGGTGLDSGLHEDNGRPVPFPGESATQDVNLRHRMPLNVGLTLSVPITDKVALTTGLNYSYLYSSSTQSFTSGSASITRELHYIGVPIALSYTFYRTGRFSFYMQAGGMAEKAVAWRETQSFASGEDSGKESLPLKVKGVQLSVNAAAGINCDLGRQVGLYIEPGLSYYFSQKDQPASYRTVHPTSFSLRIGIKFGI